LSRLVCIQSRRDRSSVVDSSFFRLAWTGRCRCMLCGSHLLNDALLYMRWGEIGPMAVMAPNIPKIDADGHLGPGLSARDFCDEVLGCLFMKTVSPIRKACSSHFLVLKYYSLQATFRCQSERRAQSRDFYSISRTTLQGLPTARTLSGRLRETTLPAPTTERDPIATPGRMIAPEPTHTSDPIVMGAPYSSFRLNAALRG